MGPTSLYPLATVSRAQLERLCQILWGWLPCADCSQKSHCEKEGCPWKRMFRLEHFLEYYKDVTSVYEPDVEVQKHIALQTHEDLFEVIKQLKSRPHISRAQLTKEIFGNRPSQILDPVDERAAIDMAVSILMMLDSSVRRRSNETLELGQLRPSWREQQTFVDFVAEGFRINGIATSDFDGDLRFLTANSLKKQLGLKFRPTDDIRNHLRLNRKRDAVDIFHHTAFLKEHLRLTKDQPHNMSAEDCVKLGTLPRQVALEVLDSIQKVLFPKKDKKSRNILHFLVSRAGFDPDCEEFESASIRNQDERDITYRVFGARLAELCEELENPSPRSWLEIWVERKSGARYVMMATLAGVAIAIVLGFLSLIVECYSAWVGYQQWKHPGGT